MLRYLEKPNRKEKIYADRLEKRDLYRHCGRSKGENVRIVSDGGHK